MSVVPSPRTRDVAHRMVRHAKVETGYDSAIKFLNLVHPEQVPALVGLLLTYVKATERPGRPRMPLQFTPQQRKYGLSRYKKGHRDELTMAQWREYQRVAQQETRAHQGLVDEAYPVSGGVGTIGSEGRHKSAPTGAATPRAGASPTDRRTTD